MTKKITKSYLKKQMVEHGRNKASKHILYIEDELWIKFVKIHKEVSDFSKKNQSHSRLLNIILSEVLKNVRVKNSTTDMNFPWEK